MLFGFKEQKRDVVPILKVLRHTPCGRQWFLDEGSATPTRAPSLIPLQRNSTMLLITGVTVVVVIEGERDEDVCSSSPSSPLHHPLPHKTHLFILRGNMETDSLDRTFHKSRTIRRDG